MKWPFFFLIRFLLLLPSPRSHFFLHRQHERKARFSRAERRGRIVEKSMETRWRERGKKGQEKKLPVLVFRRRLMGLHQTSRKRQRARALFRSLFRPRTLWVGMIALGLSQKQREKCLVPRDGLTGT